MATFNRIVCLATVAAGVSFTASAVKLSADSYANSDNSLIAQWDGIDNEGTGTHNSSAATWVDRVGNRTVTRVDKNGGGSWGENCFVEGSSATSAMLILMNMIFPE